eukprot:497710-Amphidinium_carterae.1
METSLYLRRIPPPISLLHVHDVACPVQTCHVLPPFGPFWVLDSDPSDQWCPKLGSTTEPRLKAGKANPLQCVQDGVFPDGCYHGLLGLSLNLFLLFLALLFLCALLSHWVRCSVLLNTCSGEEVTLVHALVAMLRHAALALVQSPPFACYYSEWVPTALHVRLCCERRQGRFCLIHPHPSCHYGYITQRYKRRAVGFIGQELILVATLHISPRACQDAEMVIGGSKPDLVMIELDEERLERLKGAPATESPMSFPQFELALERQKFPWR